MRAGKRNSGDALAVVRQSVSRGVEMLLGADLEATYA